MTRRTKYRSNQTVLKVDSVSLDNVQFKLYIIPQGREKGLIMALVAGRWFSCYELKETSGKSTVFRVEQSAPADDAAARASAAALATDLAAVTNSVLAKYWTYQEFVENALALPASAENQNRAILVFSIDGQPTKSGKVRIPAVKAACMAATTGKNYDIIDVVDEDVVAFAANFTSEALFYLSDGEQADALLGGGRSHTASSDS